MPRILRNSTFKALADQQNCKTCVECVCETFPTGIPILSSKANLSLYSMGGGTLRPRSPSLPYQQQSAARRQTTTTNSCVLNLMRTKRLESAGRSVEQLQSAEPASTSDEAAMVASASGEDANHIKTPEVHTWNDLGSL